MMRIDLRLIEQRGWLIPGNTYRLSWNRDGEPVGNICYIAYRNYLLLDFKTRRGEDEEWQPVQQTVHLSRTTLYFGGERLWMHCPSCHRRCLVLYGGSRFYCRKCYRLGYRTQAEDAAQRAITKSEKIRKRLGGNEAMDWPFPAKPKGMHWNTYRRLEAQDERAQEAWNRAVEGLILRFQRN